jgi:hypothetical protein
LGLATGWLEGNKVLQLDFWAPFLWFFLWTNKERTERMKPFFTARGVSLEDRLSNLAAENKKLKKTNIVLTIFLILVFISQYIEHWSDLFR